MKVVLLLQACMIVCIVCSSPSLGREVDIRGVGAAAPCSRWTLDRRKEVAWLDAGSWILGFVSGASSALDRNLIAGTSSDMLLRWIDRYCQSHSSDLIGSAANRLIEQLSIEAR